MEGKGSEELVKKVEAALVTLKETLKGDTPTGSKGAGVGFIDIARQARGGVEFDFFRLDDEDTFFTVKAYI